MIRILHVIGAMGSGGAEAMLMNLYRHIDRSKIQFDFVVHTTEQMLYDNEIVALGGRIFRTEKYRVINYISYKRWWSEFFRLHSEYKLVHGHIGSSAPVYLKEAKKNRVIAIAHSHNTKNVEKTLKKYLWECCSYPTRNVADYFFACSQEAAKDRYGKKVADSERCYILKNAIECKKYAYSKKRRLEMQKRLKLENNFVVGHIGRFVFQKNHMFLLRIFEAVYREEKSARLLLLGEGELEKEVKEQCCRLGIEQAVIFAGVHQNTEDFYAAMDVFCFPSRWEGLGIVTVEAQTSGLPCVVADTIPKEADIKAGLFIEKSLTDAPEEWAEVILRCKKMERMTSGVIFAKEAGYDVRTTAERLVEFYYECIGDEKMNKRK